jgi:deazaflavin-dependent oxidoreductase (nitroreductase family)
VKTLLKFIGESGFWRVFGRVHTRIYRLTGGRLGLKTGSLSHLLLTTTGRRSGEPRTVPLTFMQDGPRYVLVASNGGSDRHPAWWLNLAKHPEATVQVGGESMRVVARVARGQERSDLWARLKAYNPFYGQYEQITDRDIPVVVLDRRPS